MQSTLGAYLKAAREKAGLTLRDVEQLTKKRISNGQLSLLESDAIRRPSPHHLFLLASTLKADYATLLRLAGYVVPGEITEVNGDPERAALIAKVADFSAEEREELEKYIDYLRAKRSSARS